MCLTLKASTNYVSTTVLLAVHLHTTIIITPWDHTIGMGAQFQQQIYNNNNKKIKRHGMASPNSNIERNIKHVHYLPSLGVMIAYYIKTGTLKKRDCLIKRNKNVFLVNNINRDFAHTNYDCLVFAVVWQNGGSTDDKS